jgi:hypothetical protein
MRSFHYSPTTHKVADTYQNYTTGGTQNILAPNEVVQFKSDTDKAFGKVMEVFNDHHNELFKLNVEFESLKMANKVAFESLAWIEQHYPEVMHALDCTMKVHAVLDKANQPDDGAVQAP